MEGCCLRGSCSGRGIWHSGSSFGVSASSSGADCRRRRRSCCVDRQEERGDRDCATTRHWIGGCLLGRHSLVWVAVLSALRRAAFDPGVCANHRDAAETAFGEWIAEAGLDETMLEYLTAEEEAGPLAAEPGAVGGIEDPAAQLAALQERLEVLQRQVNEVPRPAPEPPLVDRAPGPGRARALFAAEPGPLTAQDWQTLRQLAGGAPPRIGGPERALQPEREHTGNILTEADLGAAVADDELQALALRNQDPLQKILAAQTLLLHRVLPKPVDALSAALEGVGSEQGSSSSGVRVLSSR